MSAQPVPGWLAASEARMRQLTHVLLFALWHKHQRVCLLACQANAEVGGYFLGRVLDQPLDDEQRARAAAGWLEFGFLAGPNADPDLAMSAIYVVPQGASVKFALRPGPECFNVCEMPQLAKMEVRPCGHR